MSSVDDLIYSDETEEWKLRSTSDTLKINSEYIEYNRLFRSSLGIASIQESNRGYYYVSRISYKILSS